MSDNDFSKQIIEIDRFIDSIEEKDGKLITILHKAQTIVGYLPNEIQNHIAHKLNIPSAKVYGVVTFYSFFNTKPKGKYQVNVCMGTACFVRGSQSVLEELTRALEINVGETTADKMFSLDSIRCIGACGLAPVISVNGKVYGRVVPTDVLSIVAKFTSLGGNEIEEN